MLTHIERKTLPYTPGQMFDLVAAVDKYNEFAPWCIASRINSRESESVFYADLIVGYKLFRERFSSKVMLEKPEGDKSGRIEIEYLKGPLKHLKNHWQFIPDETGGCVVDFSVEFEFKNSMLHGIAKVFFNEVIRRMVTAFEARAQELYGLSGRG
ncbi:MAG: type II toxin-antitoxin system RatA family toxin [Alphaproteobacteria bacterium]|nr:type II toxin-antitoxin system RatA family toxin [Alphaproteobacteria bacterium]